MRKFISFWYAVFWLLFEDAQIGNSYVRARRNKLIERIIIVLHRAGKLSFD